MMYVREQCKINIKMSSVWSFYYGYLEVPFFSKGQILKCLGVKCHYACK